MTIRLSVVIPTYKHRARLRQTAFYNTDLNEEKHSLNKIIYLHASQGERAHAGV
ncbi:hypothetical protein [Serratia quinivorans]|uniref:hypothetical protein n=1 Tax=Serratia quinivorans TaxID=137545 RepID=UPI0021792BE5|nr:hypothetical protein [Serratia quinivorans]CAI1112939.1 Uncharacterised protein [Serratia quinivorans]CAI1874846.1 Uncharacterised protein [Serratia quinivorans]